MNKFISFSLWGKNPKYLIGAVKNAQYIAMQMPEWKAIFYIAYDVDELIINKLKQFNAIIKIKDDTINVWSPSFWRFEAISEYKDDIVICRDCDSRISIRETVAIREWLDSNKKFHIIRDHPGHKFVIMAGMFGIKTDFINFDMLMENFLNQITDFPYIIDQIFLRDIIFPLVEVDSFIHDEFGGVNKIKYERKNLEYIGEPLTAKDEIDNIEYTNILKKVLEAN